MEKNQKLPAPLAMGLIIFAAVLAVAAVFYFSNKNNVKSYYTDQGIILMRGRLEENGECDFYLDPESKTGESSFAALLNIPEFKNRCDEIRQYIGKRVEIKGHVFGQSFSEPCACIPIGYIERPESISVAQTETEAETPRVEQEPVDEAVVVDTSDWQTYRNGKYGFEMKHPAAIKTDLNDFGGFLYLSETKSIVINASDEPKLENCQARTGYAESDSRVKINDIVFRKQIGMTYGSAGDSGRDVINKVVYSTIIGGKCVIIEFAVNAGKAQKALPNEGSGETYDIGKEPEIKIFEQILSTFKSFEQRNDDDSGKLENAAVCILQPYPQKNLQLEGGIANYSYYFESLGEYGDYRAELREKNFLIDDVDFDGSDEAVIFIDEYDPKSHIYPLYMQVLENNNGRWFCPGEQNVILLGGRELAIYSVVSNEGMIVVNRNAQFDSREITSKDVEEIYKFDNGKLIKVREKTIKLNEPLG